MDIEIRYIKGVGPSREKKLEKLGIKSIEDLFYYIPREYDDRTIKKSLASCKPGEKASFHIKILGQGEVIRPRKGFSILQVPISDGETNAYMVWFNQEYLRYNFKVGREYIINGKKNLRGMQIQIMNPIYENLENSSKLDQIVPIYPLTSGLTNKLMIGIMKNAMEEYLSQVNEFLPSIFFEKYGMMKRSEALYNIHFPKDQDTYIRARNRLVLEEFLVLQLGLYRLKSGQKEDQGLRFLDNSLAGAFIEGLAFELTNAQKRVFQEISLDMESLSTMNRLVQGDVGSGKTIVAILAMLKVVGSGYQASMMAPTEILAKQHYETISGFLKGTDVSVGLLTGSLKKRERQLVLDKLAAGTLDILVGTHALIQKDVEFKDLGLVITDEQHRFGVRQRALLSEKGKNPDVLVMTATPIPRTLALILYGDLDISIIDELPPGRKEIETYAVGPGLVNRVNDFIEGEIRSGRQAYIVCPLIEENQDMSIVSVEELYDYLKEDRFKSYNIGLLHGNMKNEEKTRVMDGFKAGSIDILISTTVVEVGVDVPNSNIMVIYNSERFGLAQLHQLRGRVGRGEHQSYCILINYGESKIARERMKIMERSSDGFIISEKDLELRGPGEFFGTRQHGLPELKIANLFRDMKLLKLAQKEAANLISKDPDLESFENLKLRNRINKIFKEIDGISFN